MPWPDLFELGDLEDFLRDPGFDTPAGTVARRWATGWLKNSTGLATWPNPIPDDIWAWAIELAAIAYNNPDATTSESIDDYSRSNDSARRKEILDAARMAYSGAGTPLYFFPEWDWHWVATPVTDPLTQ